MTTHSVEKTSDLALALKRARQDAGLSREEIATMTGLSFTTIVRCESQNADTPPPTPRTLRKLLDGFPKLKKYFAQKSAAAA